MHNFSPLFFLNTPELNLCAFLYLEKCWISFFLNCSWHFFHFSLSFLKDVGLSISWEWYPALLSLWTVLEPLDQVRPLYTGPLLNIIFPDNSCVLHCGIAVYFLVRSWNSFPIQKGIPVPADILICLSMLRDIYNYSSYCHLLCISN